MVQLPLGRGIAAAANTDSLILVHTYRDECRAKWGQARLSVLIKALINSLSRQQAKNSTAMHHPNSSYHTRPYLLPTYTAQHTDYTCSFGMPFVRRLLATWECLTTLPTHGHGCMSASSTKRMSVTMSTWNAFRSAVNRATRLSMPPYWFLPCF